MANPYSTLRTNIMKQQKSLLEKGYYSDDGFIDIPKISELGHEPTKEDIENLEDYRQQIFDKYKIDVTDKETGDTITLSYDEAKEYFKHEASKKAKLTKILNEIEDNNLNKYDDDDDWMKAIDEGEAIVEQVRTKIGELVGFISTAKNTGRAKRNEEIVNGIGYDLLDAFEYAEETDYSALVNRLKNNAMKINADLDRAKTAYLEKDNGKAIIEELLTIFKGSNLSIDEAKSLDNVYDEDVEVDEYGEVIE